MQIKNKIKLAVGEFSLKTPKVGDVDLHLACQKVLSFLA
jgi:hypothetical protein